MLSVFMFVVVSLTCITRYIHALAIFSFTRSKIVYCTYLRNFGNFVHTVLNVQRELRYILSLKGTLLQRPPCLKGDSTNIVELLCICMYVGWRNSKINVIFSIFCSVNDHSLPAQTSPHSSVVQ